MSSCRPVKMAKRKRKTSSANSSSGTGSTAQSSRTTSNSAPHSRRQSETVPDYNVVKPDGSDTELGSFSHDTAAILESMKEQDYTAQVSFSNSFILIQ
jgi:hypothetical protein